MTIEKRQTALMQIYREAFGEPEPEREIKPELNGRPSSGRPKVEIDEALLDKIRESANGEQFTELFDNGDWEKAYSSQSEADLALVGMLRFWLWNSGGAAAIDSYFRASALYRDKWDEKRGKQTYGELTIANATKGDFDYYGRGPDDSIQRRERTKAKADIGTKTNSKIKTDAKTKKASTKATQDGFVDFDATLTQEHRIEAPRLPVEVFGAQWADWLVGTAKAKAAPVDFTTMALLTTAASLIGNARRVAPWKEWTEAIILWISRIGEPSTNKTPGVQPIYDIMGILQWEQKDQYAEIVRKWQEDKIKAKAALDTYTSDVKEAFAEARKKQSTMIKQMSLPKTTFEPPRPVEPALMTVDATMESLGPLLAVQPKGFLQRREELSGWISGFDQYHGRGGSERSFWIEAYNGHHYNIRRAKFDGGSLDIKYLSISIEGSMQPDRLGTLLLEGDDDGLTARFLFSWPDSVAFERPSGEPAQAIALNALRRLRDLEMVGSDGNKSYKTVMFNTAAAKLFEQWRIRYPRGEKGLSGKPLSWHGKLPGVVLRLALVLTYLRWCIEAKSVKEPSEIAATRVSEAIKLVEEYFMPMANRMFGDAKLPESMRNAKIVAKAIQAKQFGEKRDGRVIVNMRQIHQQYFNRMGSEDVQHAFDELVEAGWLRRIEHAEVRAGRPRKDYEVNPRVFTLK